MNTKSNQLWRRLWIYQSERFPIFQHGLLILAFTYAAVNYSVLSRGGEAFISLPYFLVGVLTTLCLFFSLRVLDEVKDKKKDAQFRSHLPVPRGLVTIKELAWIGLVFALLVSTLIGIVYPRMFLPLTLVLAYLALMTLEFFIPRLLNKNLLIYASSHMLIIPFIDIYASGLDWYMKGLNPHTGLILFFVVSFFNGMTIEVGRKIKAPKDEAPGVDTYSSILGTRKSLGLWLMVLSTTFFTALIAIVHAQLIWVSAVILCLVFGVALRKAFLFSRGYTSARAKSIENISGIWTLSMYLTLGGLPDLIITQIYKL